jgi:hypothetical protein
MTTDLEQQLRTTLQGRAATVHDGPAWDAGVVPPARRAHARRLPAAAAAGVVLLAGGGLAAWRADHDGSHHAAAGGVGRPVCTATLPAAWAAARARNPLMVDGTDAFPEAPGPNGSTVVSWYPGDDSSDIGLMAPDGTTRRLVRVPPKRLENLHSDTRFLVVNSLPQIPADSPDRPVDEIDVVRIATGHSTAVLPGAPMPSGWVVSGHGAVIQNGVVYWGAQPSRRDQSHGIVISYDIDTRVYRVLAHVGTYPDVELDRRGVGWPGGSVPAEAVPQTVPPIFNAEGDYRTILVSDGSSYAWTVIGADQFEVHWADSAGHTLVFHVSPVHDSRFAPLLVAVAGPYVFMGLDGDGSYTFVLDTRTAALAATTGRQYSALDSGDLFVSPSRPSPTYRVDASALPELHC